MHSELFKYMVTVARVVFAAKCMAKLTSYIHNRPISEFQEKLKAFFNYITENQ